MWGERFTGTAPSQGWSVGFRDPIGVVSDESGFRGLPMRELEPGMSSVGSTRPGDSHPAIQLCLGSAGDARFDAETSVGSNPMWGAKINMPVN